MARAAQPDLPVSLSELTQLCPALYCNICDCTAQLSLVLEKTQILFITHYFLSFYYSVMCFEKLEKCPGQGADGVLF